MSAPSVQGVPIVRLMGFELHAVTMDGAIDHIARAIGRGEGGWVVTPNLDILRQVSTLPDVYAVMDRATLRLADGMPLIWASRLKRTPLPERVSGSDIIVPLSQRAAREGWRVFMLGGNPGVADAAAAVLMERAPGLKILGTECPPFGFERDPAYRTHLSDMLRAHDADLIYVALGSPKQEVLISELRSVVPRAWFLGVGFTFSFVSGQAPRAPHWMRRAGLEWMHRLANEPRRLARRYLVQGLPFAAVLLSRAAWEGAFRTAQSKAV